MRADIRLEGPHRDRIREALTTGDFFITPPCVVFDLEAALRGLNVSDAGEAAESFFRRTPTDFLSLSAGDLRQVIEMALRQHNITARQARHLFPEFDVRGRSRDDLAIGYGGK